MSALHTVCSKQSRTSLLSRIWKTFICIRINERLEPLTCLLSEDYTRNSTILTVFTRITILDLRKHKSSICGCQLKSSDFNMYISLLAFQSNLVSIERSSGDMHIVEVKNDDNKGTVNISR